MKKKDILNLIRCHAEKNEAGFRSQAYKIANEFDQSGDTQLAAYIMSLLSDANTFIPQEQVTDFTFHYLANISTKGTPLFLPSSLVDDLMGAVHAVERNLGINKFLFEGSPGTGKTEAAKHIARVLNRQLYSVTFSTIIDSKLGQTQKNLVELFKEINQSATSNRYIILFDEFDTIALDRIDANDLREMGRAASELLKLMEHVNPNVIIIATTNLYSHFDKAILRRFDAVIHFDSYTKQDIQEIGEKMLSSYMTQMKIESKDMRLFRKILKLANPLPTPGILKNMIRTSLAFSNPEIGLDYLRRLYTAITGYQPRNPMDLKKQGFTVREIGILLNESKSNIDRKLKEEVSTHA